MMEVDYLTSLDEGVISTILDYLPINDRIKYWRLSSSTCTFPIFRKLASNCDTCQKCIERAPEECLNSLQHLSETQLLQILRQSCQHLTELVFSRPTSLSCQSLIDILADPDTSVLNGLERIDLSGCKGINDHVMELIGEKCPRLKQFAVKDVLITDVGLSSVLMQTPYLEKLSCSGCHLLTDKGLFSIASCCPELRDLTLMGCHKVSDAGVIAVTEGCKQLSALNLRFCHKISDRGVKSIAEKLQRMERLNLRYCFKITDASVEAVAKHLDHLKALNLSQCNKISDEGILALCCNSPGIEELSLWGCCRLSDYAIYAISTQLPSLRRLDIRARDRFSIIGGSSMQQYLTTYRDTLSRWQQLPSKSGVFERQ